MIKIIKLIITLTLITFFSNPLQASNSVKLDIRIVKITDEKISCNFTFHIKISKNDTFDIFLVALPFTQNQNLKSTILTKDAELLVTYGFNSTGKGVMNINSFKKASEFDIEFSNVELPIKPSLSDENGLIVTLDFSNDFLPQNLHNIKVLSFNEFEVKNTSLTNSNPKFKLLEKDNYQLNSSEQLDNIYFVIPKPRESFISTFLAFMTIAIFIGIFSSIKMLKGKTESIIGGIIALLLLVYLAYLVFSKIIPEDFTKDIDMISLIGGGIGLFSGILLNSIYNLIVIYTIEKQQS